jgi:hypothetical protein
LKNTISHRVGIALGVFSTLVQNFSENGDPVFHPFMADPEKVPIGTHA